MNIIYMHHASRDMKKGENQENPITKSSKKEARIIGKVLREEDIAVCCIYQGEFLRYSLTTKQINKKIKAPVVVDNRLNEFNWKGIETAAEYEKRIHAFINDIIEKHNNTDTVVCITSGVALHWFMTYFMKGTPIKGFVRMSPGVTVSPVGFHYDKEQKRPYITSWKGHKKK